MFFVRHAVSKNSLYNEKQKIESLHCEYLIQIVYYNLYKLRIQIPINNEKQ